MSRKEETKAASLHNISAGYFSSFLYINLLISWFGGTKEQISDILVFGFAAALHHHSSSIRGKVQGTAKSVGFASISPLPNLFSSFFFLPLPPQLHFHNSLLTHRLQSLPISKVVVRTIRKGYTEFKTADFASHFCLRAKIIDGPRP